MSSSAPAQKKPSVLSFRGFRNLWIGQLISMFGDTLYTLVFLWLVLEATGDAAAVGIVLAFEVTPYVLFSWYAGTVVDRLDRRWILIASDIVSAALVFVFAAIVAFETKPSLPLVSAFAFTLGCANVFAAPAKSASVPRLVPPERLVEANSLTSSVQSGMPLVGNLLAAAVLGALFKLSATLAYVATFAFNGLTFLVSAVFMMRLPSLKPQRTDAPKHPIQDAIDGIRFALRHRVVLIAVLMSVAINLCVAPFMPAYVVVAQERFQGTPGLLAFLEVWFFLGMVAGSLVAYRYPSRRPGLAFAVFLVFAGLPIIPMGFVHVVWVFCLLNFLCGLFVPMASIPMNTFIQLETPDAYRGRVNAALSMISATVLPLGYAMSGFLIRLLGLEGTFALIGLAIAVFPLAGLASKAYRESRLPDSAPQAEAAQQAEAPSVGDKCEEMESPPSVEGGGLLKDPPSAGGS